MDIICIPIDTILEPVRLSMIDARTVKFTIDPKITELLITTNDQYRIELRGLKMNKIPFKNSWPSYGSFCLNGTDWNHTLFLPEREQSRKRKDDPLNLTMFFKKKGKKTHLLSLEKKKTPPNHDKNEDKNCYIVGLFLVQKLEIPQIIEYHKKICLRKLFDNLQNDLRKTFSK